MNNGMFNIEIANQRNAALIAQAKRYRIAKCAAQLARKSAHKTHSGRAVSHSGETSMT